MRGGRLARGAVQEGHATYRAQLALDRLERPAIGARRGVIGLHHVDRGSPGPGQGVFRIFAHGNVEILHRGGKVVDGLLENGAHHARLEGRVAQVPPGPQPRLRVTDVARVAFRTGELVIALGEPERRPEVLRVTGKLGAQLPQLARDRVTGPDRQALEHRRIVLGHIRRSLHGGGERRERQTAGDLSECADDGCPGNADGCGSAAHARADACAAPCRPSRKRARAGDARRASGRGRASMPRACAGAGDAR